MTSTAMPALGDAPAVAPPTNLAIAASDRIEALDVVRGFALIGIALMNIEFFNRAIHSMGTGMPENLTGLDWLASYFIAYFVQGKFWTIFSTLFGMGFAVMFMRAEKAGRNFLPIYLRRLLGLAVFGAAHYIFLWDGDILFSYSIAACALMLLMYSTWKPYVAAFVIVAVLCFFPMFELLRPVAFGLLYVGLCTLFMRSEKTVPIGGGRRVPLFSFILGVLGVLGIIGALCLWFIPGAPKGPRIPVTILALIAPTMAYLSARYRQPEEVRALRFGVANYVMSASIGILFGAAQYFMPPPAEKPAAPAAAVTAPAAASASAAASTSASAMAAAAEKEKAEAERIAKDKKERAERLAQRKKDLDEEVRVLTKGSYGEAVMMRAKEFPEKATGDAGFATLLIGMFLIGAWFVRSGVMENTREHLPMFRKLALYALPLGIGIGVAGSFIATSHTPGNQSSGFPLAHSLTMLGNLPACLGYIGLVVVMLHSDTVFSRIRVLAPFGRMALTNYLMATLICTTAFYGYGLGHFGIGRAMQVVFVAVMVSVQIAFSHWWLARFQYGPMEWLWRGFTYRTVPSLRIQAKA